mgnify:FL=1
MMISCMYVSQVVESHEHVVTKTMMHEIVRIGVVNVQNSAPPPAPGAYGGQAVAVLLNGDKMAFYECGFYGSQDTLFDYEGRHYFKNCYIQGAIDFIFGHGQSLYKVYNVHGLYFCQHILLIPKRARNLGM